MCSVSLEHVQEATATTANQISFNAVKRVSHKIKGLVLLRDNMLVSKLNIVNKMTKVAKAYTILLSSQQVITIHCRYCCPFDSPLRLPALELPIIIVNQQLIKHKSLSVIKVWFSWLSWTVSVHSFNETGWF